MRTDQPGLWVIAFLVMWALAVVALAVLGLALVRSEVRRHPLIGSVAVITASLSLGWLWWLAVRDVLGVS